MVFFRQDMDVKPVVSVIVPNYNHSAYLKERIDSILAQTYKDYEILLLDDASTDDSISILRQYAELPAVSHLIVNKTNGGSPFSQWKKGIESAAGKYIWIAESDDKADPHFLEKTVIELEGNPDARICFTGSYFIDAQGREIDDHRFDNWKEDGKAYFYDSRYFLVHSMYQLNNVYNASMVLFRKEGSLEIPEECFKMRYCGDWLFWTEQIMHSRKVISIHEKLNYFRQHQTNTTKISQEDMKVYPEVLIVKKIFWNRIISDPFEILEDKSDCYSWLRHSDCSPEIKRELYVLAHKAGLNWLIYRIGRLVRSVRKAICLK